MATLTDIHNIKALDAVILSGGDQDAVINAISGDTLDMSFMAFIPGVILEMDLPDSLEGGHVPHDVRLEFLQRLTDNRFVAQMSAEDAKEAMLYGLEPELAYHLQTAQAALGFEPGQSIDLEQAHTLRDYLDRHCKPAADHTQATSGAAAYAAPSPG